eukprot:NODE_301_length_10368_cov_0.471614.p7 type:complete len:102 gc:universal NODE_301_length_10368_cov_0.471614:3992-3687(-)
MLPISLSKILALQRICSNLKDQTLLPGVISTHHNTKIPRISKQLIKLTPSLNMLHLFKITIYSSPAIWIKLKQKLKNIMYLIRIKQIQRKFLFLHRKICIS